MVDLVTLNTNMPGYADFAKGMAMQNEVAKGQLEYQKMRDEYEAQKGLRALFAQNPNASFGDISQFSPQLATELMKAQQEGEQRIAQTKKTKREISDLERKTVASTLAPIAEEALSTGDMKTYNERMGNALSELEQQGIPLPANFDAETHTPQFVLNNALALGYKSPYMENLQKMQQEQMLNQVPPRMTPQQAYGSVEMGPYGARQVPALPRTGMQNIPQSAGPETRATIDDLPALQQAYEAEQDPNNKFQIGKMINDIKQTNIGAGAGFITPQQEMELKVQEEKLKKGASLEAEQEAAAEQQLGTLKALDTRNVDSLIDKSLTSRPEQLMKGEYGLSGMAGMPTEANTATEELTVIEAQMRDMAKAIVGAGPISEGEQKIISKALGGIATPKDPESRKAAYHEFVSLAKEKISKYPHLAQQMNAIEGGPAKVQSQATPKSLKIGEVKNGYEYLGGDPKDKTNWKKVR